MKTIIFDLLNIKDTEKCIKKAGKIIKDGGVVVFPTETVYGIGANAFDKNACAKIFEIKGRMSDNPLIVHVSGIKMAEKIGKFSDEDKKLMKKLWPGPITIIIKAKNDIPKIVTGGLDTVAVRVPKNNIALKLIKSAGVPIAAPSANPSGFPSATSGEHVEKYFNGKVDLILKYGKTRYGIESTVIDIKNMSILRPGSFDKKKLESIIGMKIKKSKTKIIRSPGMKYRHYSPKVPLIMFTGDRNKLKKILEDRKNFAIIGSFKFCNLIDIPKNNKLVITRSSIKEAKRNLFDALIKLDSLGVKFGIIERFDKEQDDGPLMNRIMKACDKKYFNSKNMLDDKLL